MNRFKTEHIMAQYALKGFCKDFFPIIKYLKTNCNLFLNRLA